MEENHLNNDELNSLLDIDIQKMNEEGINPEDLELFEEAIVEA